MTTVLTIAALLCILLLPFPIVWITRKNKLLGALGAVGCCYLVGFAFSTLGLSGVSYDKELTTTVAYVLVALSIPLILFSIDLSAIRKLTRMTAIGYGLCILSALGVSFALFFVTRSFFPAADLAAMTVGLYTGGTPNMNAIGAVMGAQSNALSAANLADTLVGGLYLLFLLSFAPRLYRFLLRKCKKARPHGKKASPAAAEKEEAPTQTKRAASDAAPTVPTDDYRFGIDRKDKKAIAKLAGAFGLSVACLGVGALLEFFIEGTVGANLLYILLSVSLLGAVLSFIPSIRRIRGQYTLGMYLVLMFSLALSMSIDWSVFLTDILPILAFFAVAQMSVILVHLLFCRIAGVDGDTALITSTAGIYGPPFIAPVANVAGRSDLIAPGVICGALGLAIGTLLGLGVGQCFLLFL